MPLNKIFEYYHKHGKAFETTFWIIVFALVYVAMMKVMHPGWNILGY